MAVQIGEDGKLHIVPEQDLQAEPMTEVPRETPEMPPEMGAPEMPPGMPPEGMPPEVPQEAPPEEKPNKTAVLYSAVEDSFDQWIEEGLIPDIDPKKKPKILAEVIKAITKASN